MSSSKTRPERGGLPRFYVREGLEGSRFYVVDGQTGQPIEGLSQIAAIEVVELLNAIHGVSVPITRPDRLPLF